MGLRESGSNIHDLCCKLLKRGRNCLSADIRFERTARKSILFKETANEQEADHKTELAEHHRLDWYRVTRHFEDNRGLSKV